MDQLRISQCAVAGIGLQGMAFDQAVEVVPFMLGKQGTGKFDGAQHRRAESDAETLELAFQETVIKFGVVRDEQAAFEPAHGFGRDAFKRRGIGDHGVADAGQLLNKWRNADAGIDQLLPFAHRAVGIDFNDADFGNAVVGGGGAGGFKIDEGEWAHGCGGGCGRRDDSCFW